MESAYAGVRVRPPKRLIRAVGALQLLAIKASRGRIGSHLFERPILLLTTTGRRTGRPRTQPLLYVTEGDCFVVVASFSGHDQDPAWLANIRANPNVVVTIGGRDLRLLATIASPSERERLWPRFPALNAAYARYQRMTARVIPVVKLCPRS
jgi:deazaflavin-dependent oxidoreductase (nitroreductase family)